MSLRLKQNIAAPTLLVAVCAAASVVTSSAASVLHRASPPAFQQGMSLSDSAFWDLFVSASEPNGNFGSENFVSNEVQYQDVIATLQRTLPAGGVYLGVGPEQNLTYIANLKPALAVVVDIRRQNAIQHLMFKALFELCSTRLCFVERLFSRALRGKVEASDKVERMLEAAEDASPNDSVYSASLAAIISRLTRTHNFALSPADQDAIAYVLEAFFNVGPRITYGTRQNGLAATEMTRNTFASFAFLQHTADLDGVQRGFLASDANYATIREMQLRNLVVPLVGDFAGPKALRAVGDFLKQRKLRVTSFYVSNVEQFLFPTKIAAFYESVATLPLDSLSVFIRTMPRGSVAGGIEIGGGPAPPMLITGRDGTQVLSIFARPAIVGDALISGTGSIVTTLSEFRAGNIRAYRDAIALTQVRTR